MTYLLKWLPHLWLPKLHRIHWLEHTMFAPGLNVTGRGQTIVKKCKLCDYRVVTIKQETISQPPKFTNKLNR